MTDKEKVISLLSDKLSEKNIQLIEDKVFLEWTKVQTHFENRLKEYKAIDIVLLGEATVNAENYLLNTENQVTTSFLEPKHFGMTTKIELNEFLIKNKIFAFDLYAIPLATLIYDNITFTFKDKNKDDLYIQHLNEHFSQLKNKLGDNSVKLVLRYTKLTKRREWIIFKNYFANNFRQSYGKKDSDIPNISKNIRASEVKIQEIFGHLIKVHNLH
jgi:hypothetical protein